MGGTLVFSIQQCEMFITTAYTLLRNLNDAKTNLFNFKYYSENIPFKAHCNGIYKSY